MAEAAIQTLQAIVRVAAAVAQAKPTTSGTKTRTSPGANCPRASLPLLLLQIIIRIIRIIIIIVISNVTTTTTTTTVRRVLFFFSVLRERERVKSVRASEIVCFIISGETLSRRFLFFLFFFSSLLDDVVRNRERRQNNHPIHTAVFVIV